MIPAGLANPILSFLSRDWAGLAVAGALALAGALVALAAPWVGLVLLAPALALAVGAGRHVRTVAALRRRFPAPGVLVDIGGYRLHVLAEGPGERAVVWFPGSHGPAFGLHHLHRAIRGEARSILVDRPATGWSDIGPFPRTTAREADEIVAALAAAGEAGPFVLVGHSFGGLLAANIARRYRDRVAALVLLDATPPDTVIYGPPIPTLPRMAVTAWGRALRLLAGLHADRETERHRKDPATAALLDRVDQELGAAAEPLNAFRLRAASACADASIFRELNAPHLARHAWQTVTYDGDLDGLPVYVVAPQAFGNEASFLAAGADAAETARRLRVLARTRERYLAVSGRARRIVTPPGTGHLFPFETPDVVIEAVRAAFADAPHPWPEQKGSS